MKSAQSQFPLVTQPKRMINQTGGSVEERIAEERESSNAQIRTMFCPGEPHEHSPNAPKFEDRSKERQSGKSKVPAKQRGSWRKVC